MRVTNSRAAAPGIFSVPYLWTTIGACTLVFLGAFENLAVTTIMPVVAADLDGARLFALAFAAPLAAGVGGMVVAGNWSDRSGPTLPLYASGGIFIVGLLVAGTAGSMWAMVVGRLVQGFGAGAVTVALYVLVARVYPPMLHQRIFAGFAAAWVVPSLIGPYIAGVVARVFSWHWVFLGVVGLVLVALVMVIPAIRGLAGRHTAQPLPPWEPRRMVWALVAVVAVLAVNLSELVPLTLAETVGLQLEEGASDAVVAIIAIVAVALVLIAVRPLVPPGTLTARRGLPTVVLLRGLAAGSFLASEVYVPYLLIDRYAFSPENAGLALTGGAVSWALASWLQGRLGERLPDVTSMRLGATLVFVSVLAAFATALLGLSPAVVIVSWVAGGAGMGLMYPRLSTMTLARSTPSNQGFNSSAISIADALGASLALAVSGLIVAAFGVVGGSGSFAAVFAFTAVVGIGAIVVAGRVEEPSAEPAAAAQTPGTRLTR